MIVPWLVPSNINIGSLVGCGVQNQTYILSVSATLITLVFSVQQCVGAYERCPEDHDGRPKYHMMEAEDGDMWYAD